MSKPHRGRNKRPTYSEKLKDPRWQKRRLHILERDQWACQRCFGTEDTLHVHHRWYHGEPWDAPEEALETLCVDCHDSESSQRAETEERLLAAMRRCFTYSDVEELAGAIECVPTASRGYGGVVADAMAWFVRDDERRGEMVATYLEGLLERRKDRRGAA